eukprot:scaffold1028_cov135-Cylindrotheca_fusiformis.AAC.6
MKQYLLTFLGTCCLVVPTRAFVSNNCGLQTGISPGYRIPQLLEDKTSNKRRFSVCFMTKSSSNNARRRKEHKKWDTMLPRLQEYYRKHGHSDVTKDDNDDDLFQWTRYVRYHYVHQIRNSTGVVGKRYRRRLSPEKLKALEEVDFVWETNRSRRNVRRWDDMMDRLRRYREKHGHVRIRRREDPELLEWTKTVRYTYRHQALNTTTTASSKQRPRLSKQKMKQLERLGFDWGTTRNVRRWDVMLPKLKAFHEKHGHVMVMPADDLELYQWIKRIRNNYRHQNKDESNHESSESFSSKKRSRPQLSRDKLKTLNDLGFCWIHSDMTWERQYQELCSFRKKNGHCHVLYRENPKLHGFVHRQRREYRRYLAGNSTSMTTERIERLSQIQFEWSKSHEISWEERRADLEDYWKRSGHANVPQDYDSNYQLGQWCMNQRIKYRNNHAFKDRTGLTAERIRKLDKLSFEWNRNQQRWMLMFQRLRQYQEDNDSLEIPTSDVDNRDLRQWLNEQRHYYRTNRTSRMTPERIELMETIPDFSWRYERSGGGGPSASDWDQLFGAIREKGIQPEGRAKTHWFDGVNPFENEVKTEWTEQELIALWNSDAEDEDDDDDFEEGGTFEENEHSKGLRALWSEGIEDDEEEDGDEFFEDEQSTLFLRA